MTCGSRALRSGGLRCPVIGAWDCVGMSIRGSVQQTETECKYRASTATLDRAGESFNRVLPRRDRIRGLPCGSSWVAAEMVLERGLTGLIHELAGPIGC
jgi:hypothetical protein